VGFLAERSKDEDKLLRLAASMDEFECYAAGQASRVAWVADALAEKFGLAARDREFLEHSALLHDLGEVRMGRDYIRASRELTPSERLDIERHPVISEQEVARLDLPKSVQLLVRWHQEWWNGTGYPDRLEAEEIPLSARILHIADAYCSLTADRPWRKALSDADARRHLDEWAAIEFDPAVVLVFRNIRLPDENPEHLVQDAAAMFSTFS
jgi:HD-GYP domain-containing protein (c-di-GMP phosphodiesterase class II)